MQDDLKIVELTIDHDLDVKPLVIGIHEEFGFAYDVKLDYDLDDPLRYYTNAGGIFYILIDGRQAVGTAAVKKVDGITAEIKRMYLLREYRGHGWGTRLLEGALGFCRERGFELCILDTNVNQKAAQQLYANFGFVTYRQARDTLFMRLSLI